MLFFKSTYISNFYKYFSKFVTARHQATNTVEVIRKLKKTTVFGNLRKIVSNRGTAFTSKKFAYYCTEGNINHVLTKTGVP